MTPAVMTHAVMTHVVLSVGSNIEREKNTQFALRSLVDKYRAVNISPLYETSAVGFDGPPFYNLIVGLKTEQSLPAIIDWLHQVESQAGRVRQPKSCDNRILDIDVVLYGNQSYHDSGYNVPRDAIEKYAYVLKPLVDIYPELIHPLLDIPIRQIWQRFEMQDQTIFRAELPAIKIATDNADKMPHGH